MNVFPNGGLRRKRHQSALMIEDKEQLTVSGRKFKKKALLIGVARGLSTDMGETTVPRTLQTLPTPATITRGKNKSETRKAADDSRILKGPHRDVQDIKQLLVGKFIQFTSSD